MLAASQLCSPPRAPGLFFFFFGGGAGGRVSELNLQAMFLCPSEVKPLFVCHWGLKQSESKRTASGIQVG